MQYSHLRNRTKRIYHFGQPIINTEASVTESFSTTGCAWDMGKHENMGSSATIADTELRWKEDTIYKKTCMTSGYLHIKLQKNQVCCDWKALQIEDSLSMIQHCVIDVLSLCNYQHFHEKINEK